MIPLTRPPAEDTSESQLQAEIRKHIGSLPDVRLWRNNTGQTVALDKSRLLGLLMSGKIREAIELIRATRPVKFGLAIGSADIVGIVAPRGRWLAIEVKAPGWVPAKSGARFEHEEEQRKWMAIVRAFGGVAGFAASMGEAMKLVEEARG